MPDPLVVKFQRIALNDILFKIWLCHLVTTAAISLVLGQVFILVMTGKTGCVAVGRSFEKLGGYGLVKSIRQNVCKRFFQRQFPGRVFWCLQCRLMTDRAVIKGRLRLFVRSGKDRRDKMGSRDIGAGSIYGNNILVSIMRKKGRKLGRVRLYRKCENRPRTHRRDDVTRATKRSAIAVNITGMTRKT